MNQKERMIAGLLYRADKDGLPEERINAQMLCYTYNQTPPNQYEKRVQLLDALLGSHGKNVWIEAPFRCDYGSNIHVGENFYANYDCIFLDVAPITIGSGVMLAPRVGIYTAGHPVHPETRNSGWKFGRPVRIGDNSWIGANVVICPGVTIGANCVIGAGSVVTKDIPDNSLAVGNPCRVLREITEADRNTYFRGETPDIPLDLPQE